MIQIAYQLWECVWYCVILCLYVAWCTVVKGACEAAFQHLVRLSGVQWLKPWGRCMVRQEHVGTRGGDGEPLTIFFLMTLILCLRSSCSNSCLILNKAKPLSQKGRCHTSEHVKTAVHHSQYITANTQSHSQNRKKTNYSVLIAFEKCISFFPTKFLVLWRITQASECSQQPA